MTARTTRSFTCRDQRACWNSNEVAYSMSNKALFSFFTKSLLFDTNVNTAEIRVMIYWSTILEVFYLCSANLKSVLKEFKITKVLNWKILSLFFLRIQTFVSDSIQEDKLLYYCIIILYYYIIETTVSLCNLIITRKVVLRSERISCNFFYGSRSGSGFGI